MNRDLNVVPEDSPRATAVIAHTDDPGHGTTGAIAHWTRTGRSAPSVVVTDGVTDLRMAGQHVLNDAAHRAHAWPRPTPRGTPSTPRRPHAGTWRLAA